MKPESEQIRELFVNPRNPSVEEFAQLGGDTIRAMAQIYAFGGRIDQMSPAIKSWLESSLTQASPDVRSIIGKVLYNEAGTRKFDANFMGQIHPQGNEVGIIANLIAAYMNTNTVVREVSPTENRMECESLDWLAKMFGYDLREFSGNIVTGGSAANLAALWAAREYTIAKLKEIGKWKRNTRLPHLYVIGTEMAHYSVAKACDELQMIFVKLPAQGFKTSAERVNRAVEAIKRGGMGQVAAIVGLAGETETGLIDDLESLAAVANKNDIHFHVDAAYGGPFILCKPDLFKGINRADSIVIDPHKLLYVPYSAGAILFKDKRRHMLIEKGMREKARYLLSNDIRYSSGTAGQTEEAKQERNFGLSRVEGSLGSGGVIATWATIQLFGREGLKAVLDHTLELTQYAYQRVSPEGSAILRPIFVPETNTLLIGLSPGFRETFKEEKYDYLIRTAATRLDQTHHYYISCNEEVDNRRAAFRFVAMHPYTTTQDVEGLIDTLEKEVSKLVAT